MVCEFEEICGMVEGSQYSPGPWRNILTKEYLEDICGDGSGKNFHKTCELYKARIRERRLRGKLEETAKNFKENAEGIEKFLNEYFSDL